MLHKFSIILGWPHWVNENGRLVHQRRQVAAAVGGSYPREVRNERADALGRAAPEPITDERFEDESEYDDEVLEIIQSLGRRHFPPLTLKKNI
jgi:hypothetical protein